MPRVSPDDVRDIAELDEMDDADIMTFIYDANALIEVRVKGYVDEEVLEPAEKWLSAHFAVMHPDERTTSEEGIGQSDLVFEGESGLGLQHSRYGQQVMNFIPEHLIEKRGYSTAVHSEGNGEADYDPQRWG